jgi:hypothetical protein
MIASMLKSFLPDDFDMEKSIRDAQQLMTDFRTIAETVTRIEQKIDSEIVTLRGEVAALTLKVGTLPLTPGESNDDRSHDHGATDDHGAGATGSVAGS